LRLRSGGNDEPNIRAGWAFIASTVAALPFGAAYANVFVTYSATLPVAAERPF
jgi:hypothetical protein